MRSDGKRKRPNCQIELKFVLPAECKLDEEVLRERVESNWSVVFKGLCDSCPLRQEKGGD